MIGSLFTQLAGVFQSKFSNSFWFASFMPVAMATTVHLIIAGLAFPALVPLETWLDAGTGTLGVIGLIAAGVFVLAYAIGPLTPVALGFLDASRTPVWFQEVLRRARLKAAYQAREAVATTNVTLAAYQQMRVADVPRMIAARQTGITTAAFARPDVAEPAIKEVAKVVNSISRGGLPSVKQTSAAIASLITALSANSTTIAQDDPQAGNAAALTRAQGGLAVALIRAAGEAEHQLLLKKQRYGAMADMTPPEATRMGDARQAAERYSHDLYGIRFEFIWPRLLLIMSGKDGSGTNVADAQAQVDFAVISTCMAVIIVAVWVPVLAVFATSPWLLLGVAASGVLMCGLFYELAVAAQWALVHVIKATIDRHRIELLGVLHQPLPATRAAERRIWSALELDDNAPGSADIPYRYQP